MVCRFFFKQKTAYEMRISDWSSDVCSSDLILLGDIISVYAHLEKRGRTSMGIRIEVIATRDRGETEVTVTQGLFTFVALDENHRPQIGRASCRERVCQYV